MLNFKEIKNIVFDIGDVLLTINKLEAQNALKNLPIDGKDLAEMILNESGDYFKYEQGLMNCSEFRNSFRKKAHRPISDEEIDQAWCAMLGNFSESGLNWLKKLKDQYRLFILSNTNAIHIEAFNKKLKQHHNLNSLDELVEKAYYSNEIKLRKPNLAIYNYLLNDSNLLAQETLFIDDREENLSAAAKLGIQTYLFTANSNFDKLFENALKQS